MFIGKIEVTLYCFFFFFNNAYSKNRLKKLKEISVWKQIQNIVVFH